MGGSIHRGVGGRVRREEPGSESDQSHDKGDLRQNDGGRSLRSEPRGVPKEVEAISRRHRMTLQFWRAKAEPTASGTEAKMETQKTTEEQAVRQSLVEPLRHSR